jgi:flagellar protein FliL
MSDEPGVEDKAEPDGEDRAEPDGEDRAEPVGKKKGGGKGKLIAVIAAVVVVIAGGGAAAYFTGLLGPIFGIRPAAKMASLDLGTPVTHELPQIKADLKTGRCSSPLIRTTMVIQINSTDLPRLQGSELRVIDSIRTHLREQERQDLVGKHGTDKLRADLTNIINNAILPAKIQSILFKEFIVQ